MLFPRNSSKTLHMFKKSIKFNMFAWHPVIFAKRKDSTFLTPDLVSSQSNLVYRNKLQAEFRNCVPSTIQHQPCWRNARDLTFYWAIINNVFLIADCRYNSSHTSTNAQPVPILPTAMHPLFKQQFYDFKVWGQADLRPIRMTSSWGCFPFNMAII